MIRWTVKYIFLIHQEEHEGTLELRSTKWKEYPESKGVLLLRNVVAPLPRAR
jgi:hypothetical protein